MADFKPTVVIDLGSGESKAGLSDSEYPTHTVPTVVSYDDCAEKSYPIDHGVIQNFNDVENILEDIVFRKLKVNPEDHPVLITQPPKNPQQDKQKLAEIMFEKFNFPALYEEIHSVLTFYASGKPAGLMVESGYGVTSVTPILSGFAISEAILRLDVGGGDLDQYLMKILEDKGYNVTHQEARKIKEKLCFVPDINEKSNQTEEYILPDKTTIVLGQEITDALQPLFQPALVEQYDCPGIHEMIFQSIFQCGIDLRRDFANNIILSGGNTLLPGLETRLQSEIESRVPPTMKVNIMADEDRKHYVWKGGAILGSLSTFPNSICISKQDFEEHGAPIVGKKFCHGL